MKVMVKMIKEKNFESAETLLNKAIKQSPNYALPYKYIGEIRAVSRDLVKAIENWEKFINLAPEDSHQVFEKMENALFDMGRYSEVENFYRKVLDNDPLNFGGILRLANVLNEKGRYEGPLPTEQQWRKAQQHSLQQMGIKAKKVPPIAEEHFPVWFLASGPPRTSGQPCKQ